jgi:uncharacterized membrane protein YgcG
MNPKLKVKTRILVLSLFLIFISCTDELYNIKEQHTGLDKNKISLAQFKKETTITVLKPIVSVSKTTSITSKGKLQLNDFSIDTLAIKKFIAKNNQTTYTFRIYPLSFVAQPNEIYNLVYRKVNTSWETAIFYLKRLPKENSDHKLFEKIERIDVAKVTNAVTSKSTLTTSNSGSGMCSYESLTIECDGSCDRQGYSECDGFACPTGQCVERSITYMYCNLEDYSGGGGGYGGTYGGTGGSEGGGNGSTYSGATTDSATLDPFTYFPNDLDSPVYEDPMYINSIKTAYIWDNLGNAKQRFFDSNPEYLNYFNETIQYQINNYWSEESYNFANLARNYKFEHPEIAFNDVFYNRTSLDTNSAVDIDNNKDGGNDYNIYTEFNPQQTWSTISQVIPKSQFVGWGYPGIKRNCMDYAKVQIAKNGFQISNYGSAGQTFQIYTEQNGVNQLNLRKGLSYLKYALSNNIPVIVGVDDNPGHPGNPDNSTDHFVVIVGMGSNSNGNYFQFYDNASADTSQGTSHLNLLYYNSSTGKISGKSQCSVYFNSVAHDYIITQIRKSKTKL